MAVPGCEPGIETPMFRLGSHYDYTTTPKNPYCEWIIAYKLRVLLVIHCVPTGLAALPLLSVELFSFLLGS